MGMLRAGTLAEDAGNPDERTGEGKEGNALGRLDEALENGEHLEPAHLSPLLLPTHRIRGSDE